MKTKELQDLRKKDVDELEAHVSELRSELMGLRFQHATGALEDAARMGESRRDIARVLTLIGEKRREAARSEKERAS